jgi:hypothetical protein
MLHRLLFVAGMTVGVMTPLVWAAYVSRPAPHGTPAPAAAMAKVNPGVRERAPVPPQRTATKTVRTKLAATEDVTASIPSASIPLPPAKPAFSIARSEPSEPPHPVIHARLKLQHLKRAEPARPQPRIATPARGIQDRTIPAVVDRYDGAHIIIVCAALTAGEQLRAGCP